MSYLKDPDYSFVSRGHFFLLLRVIIYSSVQNLVTPTWKPQLVLLQRRANYWCQVILRFWECPHQNNGNLSVKSHILPVKIWIKWNGPGRKKNSLIPRNLAANNNRHWKCGFHMNTKSFLPLHVVVLRLNLHWANKDKTNVHPVSTLVLIVWRGFTQAGPYGV